MTVGVLLAIAVGIGTQYLPARVPSLADGAVLAAAAGRAGRRPRRRADARSSTLGPQPAWRPSSTSSSDGGRVPIRETTRSASTRARAARSLVALLALVIGSPPERAGPVQGRVQPADGWQRDMALALTRPLADASHALHLDRPRELAAGCARTVGRRRHRRRDRCRPPRRRAAPSPPNRARDARRPRATFRRRPRRRGAEARVLAQASAARLDRGRLARDHAGLCARPRDRGEPRGRQRRRCRGPARDRPLAARCLQLVRRDPAQDRRLRPDVVVVSFGGNDDHRYMTGLPTAFDRLASATPPGAGVHAARRHRDRHVTRSGRSLVWIGLPVTRSPDQTAASRW